jgi:hypothetical protein
MAGMAGELGTLRFDLGPSDLTQPDSYSSGLDRRQRNLFPPGAPQFEFSDPRIPSSLDYILPRELHEPQHFGRIQGHQLPGTPAGAGQECGYFRAFTDVWRHDPGLDAWGYYSVPLPHIADQQYDRSLQPFGPSRPVGPSQPFGPPQPFGHPQPFRDQRLVRPQLPVGPQQNFGARHYLAAQQRQHRDQRQLDLRLFQNVCHPPVEPGPPLNPADFMSTPWLGSGSLQQRQEQSQGLVCIGQGVSSRDFETHSDSESWSRFTVEIRDIILGILLLHDVPLISERYRRTDGTIRVALRAVEGPVHTDMLRTLSLVSREFRTHAYQVFFSRNHFHTGISFSGTYPGSIWLESLRFYATEFLNNVELDFDVRPGAGGRRMDSAGKMARILGHSRFLRTLKITANTRFHLETRARDPADFLYIPIFRRLGQIRNVRNLIINFNPPWPEAEQWLRRQMTATRAINLNGLTAAQRLELSTGNYMPADIESLPPVSLWHDWSDEAWERWAQALRINRRNPDMTRRVILRRIRVFQKEQKQEDKKLRRGS